MRAGMARASVENPARLPRPKSILLCLSGGGLRATFFHLGTVRALRALGLLDKVTDIVSVSGGSIIAAHLKQHWNKYTGGPFEFAEAESILLALRSWDFRGRAVRRSLLWWPLYFLALRFPKLLARFRRGRTDLLREEYDRYFLGQNLEELSKNCPGNPQIHITATNLATGNLSTFTDKHYHSLEDGDRNQYAAELTQLSLAVAASSAFPPVFPPIVFDEEMTGGKSGSFRISPHILTDGGVYDNTGFESAILLEEYRKKHGREVSDVVVVSDAGSPFQLRGGSEFTNPLGLALRAAEVIMKRVSEETLRRIVSQDRIISVSIDQIEEDESLSPQIQKAISRIRTDLDRFSDVEVAALVRHGENRALRKLHDRLNVDFDICAAVGRLPQFPFQLPSSSILAAKLKKSDRVRWWNSFTNFRDPRTYLIDSFLLSILFSLLLLPSAWLRQKDQASFLQASANQAADFRLTIDALQRRLDENSEEAERVRRAYEARLAELLARPQPQACRDPSNGIERFEVKATQTLSSGWRPGGSSPGAWCNDAQAQLKAKFEQPTFRILSMSEESRDSCAPFRCVQYMYHCTLEVQASPVFKYAVSPACRPPP